MSDKKQDEERKPKKIHDLFFKKVFTDKEIAIDLFKGVLPTSIQNDIQIDEFELSTTTYIDEKLKEYFCDLVYVGYNKSKTPIKICILLEHKSYIPGRELHIQLRSYKNLIWEANISQNKVFEVVVPIVLYHGTDKWSVKKFNESFGDVSGELSYFLPNDSYILINLRDEYTFEKINTHFKTLKLQTVLRVFKTIRNDNFLELIPEIFRSLDQLLNTTKGRKLFNIIQKYLSFNLKISKAMLTKKIQETFDNFDTIEIEPGTMIDLMLKEERQEGELKGLKKSMLKMAVTGISKNYDDIVIMDITGISHKILNVLKKQYKKLGTDINQWIEQHPDLIDIPSKF